MARRRARHPEAAAAARAERTDVKNAQIRERCATPGFGYLVVLYAGGGGKHAEDATTYAEAAAIRDAAMATGTYDKAWIFSKVWNADMSITADPRARAAAAERWYRGDAYGPDL